MIAAVLLVTLGAMGAEAADQDPPGGTAGLIDPIGASLVVEYLDGDHVVHRVASGDHGEEHDDDNIAGKGTDEGNGPVVHDGFTTYADAVGIAGYEILLVSSSGIEHVRAAMSRAASDAVIAGAPALHVAPGTIAQGSRPDRGQIHVTVTSSSPCGGSWLGCGGPIIEDGVVVAGEIWINPRLLERDDSQIDNASRHELGHALGLGHYNWLHEDRTQTMHGSSFDALRYESGDQAGFRFISGDDGSAPDSAPAAPTASATAPDTPRAENPAGATDVVGSGPFGLVVRGWASDPDVSSPVSVLVTVDGAPFEALADRRRHDGSTNGFEVVAYAVEPGTHEVCVVVRNAGPGADTHLGCQEVEVSDRSVGRVGIQTF